MNKWTRLTYEYTDVTDIYPDVTQDLKDKGGEDWKTFNNNFGKYLKVPAPPFMYIDR